MMKRLELLEPTMTTLAPPVLVSPVKTTTDSWTPGALAALLGIATTLTDIEPVAHIIQIANGAKEDA